MRAAAIANCCAAATHTHSCSLPSAQLQLSAFNIQHSAQKLFWCYFNLKVNRSVICGIKYNSSSVCARARCRMKKSSKNQNQNKNPIANKNNKIQIKVQRKQMAFAFDIRSPFVCLALRLHFRFGLKLFLFYFLFVCLFSVSFRFCGFYSAQFSHFS